MEYTKDIILDVRYKKEIGLEKLKNGTSKLKKRLKNNKFIIITLSLLFTLTVIDIVLVNSFLQILSSAY